MLVKSEFRIRVTTWHLLCAPSVPDYFFPTTPAHVTLTLSPTPHTINTIDPRLLFVVEIVEKEGPLWGEQINEDDTKEEPSPQDAAASSI